jgi:adenine/guanine phosphoribosyltransferase-like PRPP-binding protein
MDHPPRFPWNHFPPVYLHALESVVKEHPAYAAAKAGDSLAAFELVADLMSSKILEQLWRRFDGHSPVIVNVHVKPAAGTNAIPNALARALSASLRWPRERRVIKSNQISHDGKNGYERLRYQVAFSGRVTLGLNYLLVDDFISHGGTLANLRGHILAQQGYVIGATVLTGNDYSAELALSDANLAELRRQHGHIEYWWRQRFGFGFESLTASEARFLSGARTAEGIRQGLGAVARGG